jgi:hypothetical protein
VGFSYNVRVVIDFDNTIVAYDALFWATARERGLIDANCASAKAAIRDAIRRLPDGEAAWQLLQADVYGELIERASPFPGVREFVMQARAANASLAIVSHKSAFAAAKPQGPDLRRAAQRWLVANGLIGADRIAAHDCYFEPSRAAKIERIRAVEPDVAIDDLIEIFTDPAFPPGVRRWLFAPHATAAAAPASGAAIEVFTSWQAIAAALAR